MEKLKSVLKLCIAGLFCVIPMGAQVGINTENPQTTLDIVQRDKTVKGKAFRLDDGNQGNGKILISDTNGIGTWTNPPIPVTPSLINIINYKLTNVNKDYVNNFDTKLSTNDWVVFVVDFQFILDKTGGNENRFLLANRNGSGGAVPSTFPDLQGPLNIYCFAENNTWRISLDYVDFEARRNGTWNINLVVISKKMATIFPATIEVNFGGSSIGAAKSSPL
ncbi:MAG: hypothetical protein LBD80_02020 [Tannerella sp.]|jgi:hypothetical protein|nr:hypothetical protein [Tannerella sp.]